GTWWTDLGRELTRARQHLHVHVAPRHRSGAAAPSGWSTDHRRSRGMTERQRVLLADDDPLIQRLVRTHLDRAGFRVLTAADGEAAIDQTAAEQPDLVVLDLMLPKIDGFEVCKRIREFSLVPVVMLTARGEQVDKLRGFEVGADDYLTKPFAPPELIARIR